MDDDPLAIEHHTDANARSDIYETPKKKSKEASEEVTSNRRKSILKSATTKLGKTILLLHKI